MGSDKSKNDKLVQANKIFISPDEQKILFEWEEADREHEARREDGWVSCKEFAEEIDEEEINLKIRVERVSNDKLCTIGEFQIKGDELKYKHPFDFRKATLISPRFKEAWLSQKDKDYNDWMALNVFARYLHLSNHGKEFKGLWSKIIKNGEVDGVLIRTSYRKRNPNGDEILCVNSHDAKNYKNSIPAQKTDDWFSKREFSVFLGCNKEDKKFESLWEDLITSRRFQDKPVSIELKKAWGKYMPVHPKERC